MKLAQAHSVLAKMVHATLHKELQLSKKSARWVTKMLCEEMKKEQLRTCKEVMLMIACLLTILDSFSLLVSWSVVKSYLGVLTLTQEDA
jgi:hypothetical protein